VIRQPLQGLLLALLLPLPAALAEPVPWQQLPAASTAPSAGEPRFEPLPSEKSTGVNTILWEALQPAEGKPSSGPPSVVWHPVQPGEAEIPALIPANAGVKAASVPLPPPPQLQSLNRSLAFSDGMAGPDLAWKVPQGFRWSEHWFLDASLLGASTRPANSSFWSWNNGDGVAELHLRVLQQQRWSFGLNATVRSVYQGNSVAGGRTQIGEGFATGFRLDYALSPTAGLALGAEQLIQYDNQNDTGRNLYLVASKGWWLGGTPGSFPLLVGTAGIGTGRLGDNNSLQFGCINGADASIDVSQSYPLCWSPIGSAALVFNPWWSLFSEYNSQDWLAGISLNALGNIPLRLSWGVLLANKGTNYQYVGADQLRWFFRTSIGF
jgi:hypothetical protein